MTDPCPRHLLLVGLDSDIETATKATLGNADDAIDVTTESNADEGLTRLDESVIDCVVSSSQLSDTDGVELLQTVREKYPHLPFVLVVGEDGEKVAMDAISAGVTDCIRVTDPTQLAKSLGGLVPELIEAYRDRQAFDVYRDLIEDGPVGTFVINDEIFEHVNKRTAQIFGFRGPEIVGKSLYELVDETAHDRLDNWLSECRKETNQFQEIFEARRKNGEPVHVEISGYCDVNQDNSIVVGVIQDVTDREELITELSQESSMLTSLMDQLPISLYFTDTMGRHRKVSRMMTKQTEPTYIEAPDGKRYHSAEDVEGTSVYDLIPPEFAEQILADHEEIFETRELMVKEEEVKEELDDGGEQWVYNLSAKGPWVDENGNLRGILGITININDQKEREIRLHHQKEQLEQITRILAHDLRNPLTVAQGRLDLIREAYDCEHVEIIKNAHHRIDQIIDDTLALLRGGAPVEDPSEVDLAALAEDSWANVLTGDAELRIEENVVIRADANQLRHMLENLYRNAIEHGGGDVTVRIGTLDGRSGFFVEDDGPGIPEDEREAVFEAGYTTTEDGTGFGLSIVQRVVSAHNWSVDIVEGRDGGARFEIWVIELRDTPPGPLTIDG